MSSRVLETARDVTRRLVEHFQPERVYLFGSAARGDHDADSDIDLCMVLPDNAPQSAFRPGASHEALADVSAAVDVVPWRKSDFDRRASWVKASLPATVVREGKLLYGPR